MMKKSFSLLLSCCVFVTACSSSTIISTNRPNASISVNNIPIGVQTGEYFDTKASGARVTVRLKEEGCETNIYSISKDTLNVSALIGGIFFLIPFIWILGYEDNYYFDDKCKPVNQ